MESRKIILVLYAIGMIFARPVNSQESGAKGSAIKLPPIGTRVRVIIKDRDPEWQYGMFNRLRVEPPCYRILLFQRTSDSHHIKEMLSVDGLLKLEFSVRDHRPVRDVPNNPDSKTYVGETWQEVPLDILKAAEEKCKARHNNNAEQGAAGGARQRRP